jgi:hypothetical protein
VGLQMTVTGSFEIAFAVLVSKGELLPCKRTCRGKPSFAAQFCFFPFCSSTYLTEHRHVLSSHPSGLEPVSGSLLGIAPAKP